MEEFASEIKKARWEFSDYGDKVKFVNRLMYPTADHAKILIRNLSKLIKTRELGFGKGKDIEFWSVSKGIISIRARSPNGEKFLSEIREFFGKKAD
jgi:hypothetical protein